ncbi:hypothetical protein GJ496_001682 [Pomphorhynchus laevis]|nr:hypothetical protein GJ496_001682 [Pomphorhynchus laevis]
MANAHTNETSLSDIPEWLSLTTQSAHGSTFRCLSRCSRGIKAPKTPGSTSNALTRQPGSTYNDLTCHKKLVDKHA